MTIDNAPKIKHNVTNKDINALRDQSSLIGGIWKPSECEPKFKTAIIVPIKINNVDNDYITTFLFHMHSFLRGQKLYYGIYFLSIDPSNENLVFNKGILSNVGFKEALNEYDWNCLIFHDLEMLPLNEQNIYECSSDHPIRLASFSSFKQSQEYVIISY